MLKENYPTLFLIISILLINSGFVFAQSNDDWNKIAGLSNKDIAVETTTKKTLFGKLTSAGADEIVIQIADKRAFTGQSQTLQKSEIKKIWFADLRFGKNSGVTAAIGAGIGAGIGIGLGLILLGATNGSDNAGGILAAGAAIGGGAGAALGALAGKKHKKKELIYKM